MHAHQGDYQKDYKQNDSQCLQSAQTPQSPGPKQLRSNRSKKGYIKGDTLLSKVTFSVISGNWVSTSPEVLIQVQQVVLAMAQTLLAPLKDIKGYSISRTTLARESRDFGGAAIVLTVDFYDIFKS